MAGVGSLGAGSVLFNQNQFVVTGQLQAVPLTLVADPQLRGTGQQRLRINYRLLLAPLGISPGKHLQCFGMVVHCTTFFLFQPSDSNDNDSHLQTL
jgi:hypothetical protein